MEEGDIGENPQEPLYYNHIKFSIFIQEAAWVNDVQDAIDTPPIILHLT